MKPSNLTSLIRREVPLARARAGFHQLVARKGGTHVGFWFFPACETGVWCVGPAVEAGAAPAHNGSDGDLKASVKLNLKDAVLC